MPIVGIGNGVGDEAGDGVGHALEHDREAAGVGERDRVVDDRPRGLEVLALHAEAAEGVNGLRREAEVAHHRDLGVEDRAARRRGACGRPRASPRRHRRG